MRKIICCKRIKNHKITKRLTLIVQFFNAAASLIAALLVFFEYFPIQQDITQTHDCPCLLLILSGLVVLCNLVILYVHCRYRYSYEYLKKEDDFSSATLQALKDSNEAKRRYILQTTYGKVPTWHPINYTENVLVYDVHEQIRSILYNLQRAIIANINGLTDENITVDFVYCYPTAEYKGQLPYTPYADNQLDNNTWRIITCGNHSLGGSMKVYLGRHDSFYYHVDQQGYVFCNDKSDILESHYIPSDKDSECKRKGSIVGLEIELRNDTPETVFVKGILTITTYGKFLYDDELICLEDFKDAFKENILNSFRSLIMSELAQMYIRHAVKDKKMDRETGAHIKPDTMEASDDGKAD